MRHGVSCCNEGSYTIRSARDRTCVLPLLFSFLDAYVADRVRLRCIIYVYVCMNALCTTLLLYRRWEPLHLSVACTYRERHTPPSCNTVGGRFPLLNHLASHITIDLIDVHSSSLCLVTPVTACNSLCTRLDYKQTISCFVGSYSASSILYPYVLLFTSLCDNTNNVEKKNQFCCIRSVRCSFGRMPIIVIFFQEITCHTHPPTRRSWSC